jgi:phospholipase/carboxylesterase
MKTCYYPSREIKNPDSVVVLLHGYGSNGDDLIGLAPEWADVLPNTVFVSPDAPFPCEIGFGYQWFSLHNWHPSHLEKGAANAAAILDRFLDEVLEEFGLDDSRLALVGFSQGTMMSLYVAPRRKNPIAGVLGYSGALIGMEDTAVAQSLPSKMPVHLVHGGMDPVVPIAAWYHATETLKRFGFQVSGSTHPALVHSIDEEGISEGRAFLQRIFS